MGRTRTWGARHAWSVGRSKSRRPILVGSERSVKSIGERRDLIPVHGWTAACPANPFVRCTPFKVVRLRVPNLVGAYCRGKRVTHHPDRAAICLGAAIRIPESEQMI